MLYSRSFLLSNANIKLFLEYPLKKRLNICEYDIFFIAPSRYKKVDNHYDYQPFLFSIQPNARLNMSLNRQKKILL